MRSKENSPDTTTLLRDILAMFDARRQELHDEWETLERGSIVSAENLARTEELSEMKWAIVDRFPALYEARLPLPPS